MESQQKLSEKQGLMWANVQDEAQMKAGVQGCVGQEEEGVVKWREKPAL